ncbi:DUF4136 domain-containing protein [Neisseria sp. Ec49-e6-T10]|uniref:DUF4136 domain-containing protein n=1 Tax=Neisseria sp. Ec49-e6-T10 TaxID=3140744 RepID=UPI003EBBE606
MKRYFMIFLLVLSLGACQSVPQLANDYDRARDFSLYQSFAFNTPALIYQPDESYIRSDLTESRIVASINNELTRKGLKVESAQKADLKVQAYLILDTRKTNVAEGHYMGWDPYWHDFWTGPDYVRTYSMYYQVATIQIDLIDRQTDKLVWRGSAKEIVDDSRSLSPSQKDQLIQKIVGQIINLYPPKIDRVKL